MAEDIQNLFKAFAPEFVKKHPHRMQLISVFLIGCFFTWWFIHYFSVEPLQAAKLSLEQKLIPFQTVALQKFSESTEGDALQLLAQRIGQIELTVVSILDYQEVSTWTFNGGVVKDLGGAVTSSPGLAADWHGGYTSVKEDGNLLISCHNNARTKYLEAIRRFPLYPFPYYVVGYCLQQRNEPEWTTYTQKAYEIVSVTTRIPRHHTDHDWLLAQLTK